MELTLKRLLEQAEFADSRKGYDREEVNEFLDRAVAMATKVEAKLTETMGQAKAAGTGGAANVGPSPADVEAEVERRVAARLADVPSGPSDDEVADEVHRTIVLAQRTADAAVREAREEAATLLAEANEHARVIRDEIDEASAASQADIEEASAASRAAIDSAAATARAAMDAASAASRAQVTAEAEADRRAARSSLAAEIAKLDGVRESLRADISLLERHVEEQRNQLHSTVGELQRLLEDPTGFRMAPAPATVDHDLPQLVPELDPEPHDPTADGVNDDVADDDVADDDIADDDVADDDVAGPDDDVAGADDPDSAVANSANAGGAFATAPSTDQATEASEADQPTPGEPRSGTAPRRETHGGNPRGGDVASQEPVVRTAVIIDEGSGPSGSGYDEVDHAAPGIRRPFESGPPTAPVSAVDLGMPTPSSAPATSPQPTTAPGDGDREDAEEDAFLAELRKAMRDDEPLGPREQQAQPAGELFGEDDRRSWRFGKRR